MLIVLRSPAYSFAVLCSPLWLMFVPRGYSKVFYFSHETNLLHTAKTGMLIGAGGGGGRDLVF